MTWDPINQPIDKFLLAGKVSPGLCEVTGASSPRKWDELDGYGLSGARLRFRGIALSHFSIDVRLIDDVDWVDWYAFKPLLDKPPLGQFAKSMDIFHPHLHDLGIASVVVDDMDQPVQTEDGIWTVTIKFIEWRVPKVTIASPDGAVATPADPEQAHIEQLLQQRNALAAKVDAP